MTIYHVQVGERTFRVDILGSQVFLDGIQQQVDLIRMNANNLFLLCWQQKNHVHHLQAQDEQTYAVTTQGRRIIAQVDVGPGEGSRRRAVETAQANRVCAPMPGLVVKVHTGEGEWVEKSQVLVTQESMKMQMELRAPVAGWVTGMHAHPQQQVEKGALLVDIQPGDCPA